jgi:carboxysome peptide B
MEIRRVVGSLVCTHRIEGLGHWDLRLLQDTKGKYHVATDPVDSHAGDWVFVVSGSAARYAIGDPTILTDLTIGGIIDHWPVEEAAAAQPATDLAAKAA